MHDFLVDLDRRALRVNLIENCEDVVSQKILLVGWHGVLLVVVPRKQVIFERGEDHGEEVSIGIWDKVAELSDEEGMLAGSSELLLAVLDGGGVEAPHENAPKGLA